MVAVCMLARNLFGDASYRPEPLVREVLDGAGRWLDEVSRLVATQEISPKKFSEGEEPGTEPVE